MTQEVVAGSRDHRTGRPTLGMAFHRVPLGQATSDHTRGESGLNINLSGTTNNFRPPH